jgi:hypothetical protein
VTEQTQGKGRPTPKRSEAQKRRTGPVTPPSTNRREAAKQLRAKQAETRKKVRAGSLRGDETVLIKRDQGPVRKFVRDFVDARRSISWILMPLSIVTLLASFGSLALASLAFEIFLAAALAAGVESVFTGFALSKALQARFPEEPKWKGHIRYGLARTITMRRMRVPRPQVQR